MAERTLEIAPRVHRAHSAKENGNHLRCVKTSAGVHLLAEGLLLDTIPETWPPSAVALSADGHKTKVHAVSLHELP